MSPEFVPERDAGNAGTIAVAGGSGGGLIPRSFLADSSYPLVVKEVVVQGVEQWHKMVWCFH